jgi:hypothetical protein
MSWAADDLRGRDVRKKFPPKTVEHKRPRGRPPKYAGYDFDDCARAQDDAYGPAAVQTSWAQIGDGSRRIHAQTFSAESIALSKEAASTARKARETLAVIK